MKYITTIALVTALFATPVLAKSAAEERAEMEASKKEIAQDKAAIKKQEDNLAVNRAEKQAAKERGDVIDQASQSAQIGANKVARGAHEMEKDMHEKMLEKDKKDLKKASSKEGRAAERQAKNDPSNFKGDTAKQQENLRVNRAEKEAAKARGDKLDEASQSVQIGANKAAMAGQKADREKAMDQFAPAAGDTKKEGPAAKQ